MAALLPRRELGASAGSHVLAITARQVRLNITEATDLDGESACDLEGCEPSLLTWGTVSSLGAYQYPSDAPMGSSRQEPVTSLRHHIFEIRSISWPTDATLFTLVGVTHCYGRTCALSDVSLEVAGGAIGLIVRTAQASRR